MIELKRTSGTDGGTIGKPGDMDTRPASGRLRLLVVDDDPLNQNIMELMLLPLGHELQYACDGTEALEAIKAGTFDLVFLDLMLPDMSGRDVCRQVREWEAGQRHVPIVAVTGLDMPGQPMELFKAGIDDYIFKPYDLRGIKRIIHLYGENGDKGAASEAAPENAPPEADTPILDSAGSLADFSNDVEGYKELLGDFLKGLPSRLGKMRGAQESGDFERLNRECHTLKGVSAGLGAMRLSRLATHLGRASASRQQANTGPLLAQLEQGAAELEVAAQEFLQSK